MPPDAETPVRLSESVRACIERSKVLYGEHRYEKLFELARRLKGLKRFPWGDREVLKEVLKRWNEAGQSPVKGVEKRRLWGQFLHALEKVRQPKGVEFAKLVRRAKRMETPGWARPYQGKPELVLLAKLCVVLDEHAGQKPWPLSKRQAAEAVDTSDSDALRMLQRLERDGMIVMVEKGTRGTLARRASTWRCSYADDRGEQGKQGDR